MLVVSMMTSVTLHDERHPAQADSQENGRVIVRAYFPSLELARKAVISFEAETLETEYETGYLVMELTPDQITTLTDLGFRIKVDNQYKPAPASIPSYPCYRTIEETFAAAQAIATNYPNLATWTDQGDSWEKSAGLGSAPAWTLSPGRRSTC